MRAADQFSISEELRAPDVMPIITAVNHYKNHNMVGDDYSL